MNKDFFKDMQISILWKMKDTKKEEIKELLFGDFTFCFNINDYEEEYPNDEYDIELILSWDEFETNFKNDSELLTIGKSLDMELFTNQIKDFDLDIWGAAELLQKILNAKVEFEYSMSVNNHKDVNNLICMEASIKIGGDVYNIPIENIRNKSDYRELFEEIAYSYNRDGKLEETINLLNGFSEKYIYDYKGNNIAVTNSSGVTSYNIFENNNLIKTVDSNNNEIINNKYDSDNRLIKSEIMSEKNGEIIECIDYTYFDNGDVIKIISSRSGVKRIISKIRSGNDEFIETTIEDGICVSQLEKKYNTLNKCIYTWNLKDPKHPILVYGIEGSNDLYPYRTCTYDFETHKLKTASEYKYDKDGHIINKKSFMYKFV